METKKCKICGEEKGLDQYSVASVVNGKAYLSSYCKACFAAKATGRREQVQQAIIQYLFDHPCVDCGVADPIVLEFDHMGGSKNFAVSQATTVSKAISEMESCEVRCANCHVRRHAVDNDSFRYRVLMEMLEEKEST